MMIYMEIKTMDIDIDIIIIIILFNDIYIIIDIILY